MKKAMARAGTWARRLTRAAVHFYYPWIEASHRERVPASGPLLLVANHPNSLMDPVVIGWVTQREVRLLGKAPLFDIPVFGAVLKAVGMIPAYRGMDDSAQVSRNVESLQRAAGLLAGGEAVGIFPEGKSHDAFQLEKVRSGAGRIAMQALELGAPDVTILPFGLNYEKKEKFRSAVWVRIGEPIRARAWLEREKGDTHRAMRCLTAEIESRLRSEVVHLGERGWEAHLSQLEALVPPLPERRGGRMNVLFERKRIADAMNYFAGVDRERADNVAEALSAQDERLRAAGLSLGSPCLRLSGVRLAGMMIREAFWLAVGMVPALAGLLHHAIPFVLVRGLAVPLTRSRRSTVSLTRLCLGLPVYMVWYMVVVWWLGKGAGWLAAWLWVGLMPLAGVVALEYVPRAGRDVRALGSNLRVLWRRRELAEFREQHRALRKQIKAMIAEYRQVHPLSE